MTWILFLGGLIVGLTILVYLAKAFTLRRIKIALKDPLVAKRIAALDRLWAMRPEKTCGTFRSDDRSITAMQEDWATFAPSIMARGLTDQHPDVRMRAAFYLSTSRLLPERTLPVLIAFLTDADEKRRAEAAAKIRSFESAAASAADALGLALADPSVDVRHNAAKALCWIGPAAAVALPSLMRALLDSDGRVASAAASAIAGYEGAAKSAINELTRVLANSHPGERLDAACSLVRIAGPGRADKSAPDGFISLFPVPNAVSPILAGFLTAEDPVYRRRAADGLRMMRSKGANAIDALVAAMQDSLWPERWRAAWALDWMGNAGKAALEEHKDEAIAALSTARAGSAPDDEKTYALKLLKQLQ